MKFKAHEVAQELRRIADALDREPETEVQPAWVLFYCEDKETFLATASLMPRPLVKRYDNSDKRWDRLRLKNSYDQDRPVHLDCSVPRSVICTLVKPAQEAVYECEPILSQLEEDSLVQP
jgi:hypothetical protein